MVVRPPRPEPPLAELARNLASVALAAVDPEKLVRGALKGQPVPWGGVLALGKAASAMARGAREALAADTPCLLVRPHHAPALLDPAWEQLTGGHPLPDRGSVQAGERALAWLGALAAERPLLALISGGSSACIEVPAAGLTLADLIATNAALLASGRAIGAHNAVRKHLSNFKGGGALRAASCPVVVLLLSDVPGDDPATVGSGPFTADPTTFAIALEAVAGLVLPPAVTSRLEAGARGELPETLKPDSPAARRAAARLIGSNRTAVEAIADAARSHGFQVGRAVLAGEAALAGGAVVAQGRALSGSRVALVAGGETTVTLGEHPGHGGRNQELALAAARAIADGAGEVVLTLATDGEDGPTQAAGGVVDGATWSAIRAAGCDPERALAGHDAGTALGAARALLETGNTGTNVADVALYLRESG